MAKVHTRVKRRLRIRSNLDGNKILKKKEKNSKPKTFPNTESAHNWAAKENLISDSYFLKSVKRNKRFEIVQKK